VFQSLFVKGLPTVAFLIFSLAVLAKNNVKPISYGGLTLLTTHFASIYHVTALRILNFILRTKYFYLLL